MALTISQVGTGGTNTTNNATLTLTAVTAAVGDLLLLCIAAANTGTNGVAPTATIADDASGSTNVYTQKGVTGNCTAGVAGDGASQFFFICPITTALSNATITVTFNVNVAQKSVVAYKFVPASGEMPNFVSVGTAVNAVAGTGLTSHAASTVSVTINHTIVGMAAIETDDAISGDADTTNGSWSTIATALADGGADANTMSSSSQFKTVSATGNQTWTATTVNARDSSSNYIILKADFVDAATLSGSGELATSAILLETAAASLAGDGTLGAFSASEWSGGSDFVGEGILDAAVTLVEAASADLTGVGFLGSPAALLKPSGASLNGSGVLGVGSLALSPGVILLEGIGDLTVVPDSPGSSALLSGSGVLAAVSFVLGSASVQLSGSGALSSAAYELSPAEVTFSGTGTLGLEIHALSPAVVPFIGDGVFYASVELVEAVAASLSGSGVLGIDAEVLLGEGSNVISLFGEGTLEVDSFVARNVPAEANFTGNGVLSSAGDVLVPAIFGEVHFDGRGNLLVLAQGQRVGLHPRRMIVRGNKAPVALSATDGSPVSLRSTIGATVGTPKSYVGVS